MLHVHVTCYLLLVTCLDIANIYIPLWEDSQWYAIKTYVRSGRGLPGFDTGEMKNWKNMLLRGLYIILTCTYHCERIHSGISCTCVRSGRGLPDLTLGRWKWRNYITDSYMLHVLYIADMYIPLWEDSQWYAIKTYVRSGRGLPGFDTGEMKNWRNLLLIVLYIKFWYVRTTVRGFTVVYNETYVRPGRGLPGLTLGRNYVMDRAYIYV
jgi:hypothetical protein